MRLWRVGVLVLLALCGCDGLLYGTGQVYVWNSEPGRISVQIEGRSPATSDLRLERGQLFSSLVAGDYVAKVTRAKGKTESIPFKIEADRLTVLDFGSKGCFVRADVSGMYQKGKPPVRVLETYEGEATLNLANRIDIKPGKRLPGNVPSLSREATFQRLVVVPCAHFKSKDRERALSDFIRKLP